MKWNAQFGLVTISTPSEFPTGGKGGDVIGLLTTYIKIRAMKNRAEIGAASTPKIEPA